MHSRDVTEILKVLERRVSKLESRMSELESNGEDATRAKPQHGTHGGIELSSGLSSRTVSYDSCPKVAVDKKSVLDHRKILNIAGKMSGATRISRAETRGSDSELTVPLEEGEIYEGSDDAHGAQAKMKMTAKKEKANPNKPRSAYSGQKLRSSSGAASRSKRCNGSDLGDEGFATQNTAGGSVSDPPVGKLEMRFGLMVQFPSDG
jgi:hypothetical protein